MVDETEPEDAKTPEDQSNFWQMQLALSDQDHREWLERARSVIARYKAEKSELKRGKRSDRRFAIIYANTETYRAALYGKQAKPDVRRRHQDKDRVGRQAAELLERCLSYTLDDEESEDAFDDAVFDYSTAARGTVRIVYEPTFGQSEQGQEIKVNESVFEQHVAFDDFRHSPAKTWKDVWWVAFRHRMSRQDLRENGFEDADKLPMGWQPDGAAKDRSREMPESLKRAEVWEIWSKNDRKRRYVILGHPKVLRTDEDPYQLEKFWPCPKPIWWTKGTDTLIPVTDLDQYESLADDLDECTARISALTKVLRRRGVYDASIEELKRLAKAGDNEFIAVKNYAALIQAGGLQAAFQTEDISIAAGVLVQLYQQRQMLIDNIYQVTGISDIMRGSTDPNETLGAQQLKAGYGSQRIKRRQRAVQRFIRDALRIKAEIMAEHFDPMTLLEMSGMDMQPQELMQVAQVIRSDKTRGFRIDIETDSTVFEDAEMEKNKRVEVLTAIGTFLREAIPAGQALPPLMPMLFEMLTFGVRGFTTGRQLEDTLDDAKNQLMQLMQQQQQAPPQPSPEELKAQAIQAKADTDMQALQAKTQADLQLKAADLELKKMDLQIKQVEVGLKGEEVEAKRTMSKIDMDGAIHQEALRRDAAKHDIDTKRTASDIDLQGRAAKAGVKGKVKAGQPLPPDPTIVALGQLIQQGNVASQASQQQLMLGLDEIKRAVNAPKRVRAVKKGGVMEAEIVPEVAG